MGKSDNTAKKPVAWEMYDEACTAARDALSENDALLRENQFLSDFIRWKGLGEEFEYFKKNAHEDTTSDLPFPPLVLDVDK